MTHRNIAPATLFHIDPAEHFGVEVKRTGKTCVADYRERPYTDQLRYNTQKWELTESIIEAWKQQTRASARSQYDLFADTGDSRRQDAEAAIKAVVDILKVELPRAIATARRDWETEHPRTKFNPSYSSFAAFFEALHSRRYREVGAVRGHLDDLYLPLRAYSHNEWPVEKLGLSPVTLAEREQEKAARKAKSAATKARKTAEAQAANQAEAERLEANVKAGPRRRIGSGR